MPMPKRKPHHRSSKKMTKALLSSTTLTPRLPKLGYIQVQLLVNVPPLEDFFLLHSSFAICIAVNVPLRDYQFDITQSALFSNTLVALPTGLGKTLIAAVVMYNYFRWFPQGNLLCCVSRSFICPLPVTHHHLSLSPSITQTFLTGKTI